MRWLWVRSALFMWRRRARVAGSAGRPRPPARGRVYRGRPRPRDGGGASGAARARLSAPPSPALVRGALALSALCVGSVECGTQTNVKTAFYGCLNATYGSHIRIIGTKDLNIYAGMFL